VTWQPMYAAAAVVLTADALTKLAFNTLPAAVHPRPAWILLVVIPAVALVFSKLAQHGIPAGLVAGGMLANGLDLLDGNGQNPFLSVVGSDHVVAFNLADVCLLVGFVWLVVRVVRGRRQTKAVLA